MRGIFRNYLLARDVPARLAVAAGVVLVGILLSGRVTVSSFTSPSVTPLARLLFFLGGVALAGATAPDFSAAYTGFERTRLSSITHLGCYAVAALCGCVVALSVGAPEIAGVVRLWLFWTALAICGYCILPAAKAWLLSGFVVLLDAVFSPADANSAWDIIKSDQPSLAMWGAVILLAVCGFVWRPTGRR